MDVLDEFRCLKAIFLPFWKPTVPHWPILLLLVNYYDVQYVFLQYTATFRSPYVLQRIFQVPRVKSLRSYVSFVVPIFSVYMLSYRQIMSSDIYRIPCLIFSD